MKKIWLHPLWLGLILLQPVCAVTVKGIYSAEVPVADQTANLRGKAFEHAFMQVLVKVSGSDDALQNAALKRTIRDSASYVKQFRYITRDAQDSQASDLFVLKVDFDQYLVEQLLRSHDITVWGHARPRSLLVVSYQTADGVKLVSGDATPDFIDQIHRAAHQRAIPVLFPLMDIEDMALLRVSDVTSSDFDKVNDMAVRYAPDVLVVGRLMAGDDASWQADWEVRFDTQAFKWRYNALSQQSVADQLVRHLARILVQEFGFENGVSSRQELWMQVSAVRQINQLIAVQQYLQLLDVVESVRLLSVDRDLATFKITLRNDVEDLQRFIALGDVLEQDGFPQLKMQDEAVPVLNYAYSD